MQYRPYSFTRYGAAAGSIVMRLPIRNQGKAKVLSAIDRIMNWIPARHKINEHVKLSDRAARYKADFDSSIIECAQCAREP